MENRKADAYCVNCGHVVRGLPEVYFKVLKFRPCPGCAEKGYLRRVEGKSPDPPEPCVRISDVLGGVMRDIRKSFYGE